MNTYTSTSTTSRTDAAAEWRIVRCRPREIVDASFARELETELVTVTDERDALLAEVNKFIEIYGRPNWVIAYVRLQKLAHYLNRKETI